MPFAFFIIEEKSLLFQFLTRSIGMLNPIRTGCQNGSISNWKTRDISTENNSSWSLIYKMKESQFYEQFFIDILTIQDKCLLFRFLTRAIRTQSLIRTQDQNGRISS